MAARSKCAYPGLTEDNRKYIRELEEHNEQKRTEKRRLATLKWLATRKRRRKPSPELRALVFWTACVVARHCRTTALGLLRRAHGKELRKASLARACLATVLRERYCLSHTLIAGALDLSSESSASQALRRSNTPEVRRIVDLIHSELPTEATRLWVSRIHHLASPSA